MGRVEAQRRLALLAILGALAVGWTVALQDPGVTAVVAQASAGTLPAATPRIAPCPLPARLRRAFEQASDGTAVPVSLLYAVAKVESNLREDAHSSAGAEGLLQVMPATARMLALDVSDPRTNVLAGARYLRQLIDRFGSLDLALAADNAGPTAVAAAGGAPSWDVLQYVANVEAQWRSVANCS